MELRRLRHFLTLAEHGNFHRAAAALHITPQALSASIANLEQAFGAQLFERGRNGITLTRFGRVLLPRASLICAESQRAHIELDQLLKGEAGRVTLGVGWFTSQMLAAHALERFIAQHPSVDTTLVEGTSEELHTRLLNGELDLVLSTPSDEFHPAPELRTEVLYEAEDLLYARIGHPLTARPSVTLADAVEFPWITSAGTESRTPRIFGACDAHGIPRPRHLLRTDSAHAIDFLMRHGDFVILGGALPPPFRLPFMDVCATSSIPELSGKYRALLAWRRSTALLPAAVDLLQVIREVFHSATRDRLAPTPPRAD